MVLFYRHPERGHPIGSSVGNLYTEFALRPTQQESNESDLATSDKALRTVTAHNEDIDPDPTEFATFYRATAERTFRIAYLIARGERRAAWEATQEAYGRLLDRWELHEHRTMEEKWRYVAGLAVRAVVGVDQDVAGEEHDVPVDGKSLRELVARLPATRHAVTMLFFHEEYPAQEIAAVLDVAEPEIRAHIERIRVMLKPMVDGG
jgi:hypothetical protein